MNSRREGPLTGTRSTDERRVDLDKGFRTWADRLGTWLLNEGALPVQRSADQDQRQLAFWRQNLLTALRNGTLPPEHERHLDEVAPGWRPGDRDVVVFPFRARVLGRWMVEADGQVPDRRSDDDDERRIHGWRRRWLSQLRDGTLPSQHEKYLDKVAPGWRGRSASETFHARADELGRWMRSVGTIPSRDGADAHQRKLADWRRRQVRQLSAGTLPSERQAYLDAVAPGWRPTPRHGPEAFRARADDLGRWMSTTGRIPASRSQDVHERSLVSWRESQLARLHAGTLSPERQAYLDTVAPGWRPTKGGPELFRARADELGRWMRSTSEAPSRQGTEHERHLSEWRYRQLDQLRAGALEPEREAYLDAVAPGWRPAPTSTVAWFRSQADDLGRWLALTDGKIPSHHSDDPHELRLARWRQAQLGRLRAGTLPPDREEYLDEVAPRWRARRLTGVEGFRSRARALGQWFASNDGKAPSHHSDDRHEARLGAWRQARVRDLRAGTLPPEQEQYLDEVASGWRPTVESEEFLVRAAALGRWFAAHDGRVPSGDSDDPHERRLRWWRIAWNSQRRDGTLPPERERHLDEVAAGWRSHTSISDDVFPARAAELGRWIAAHDGKVPSYPGADPHERQLHGWRAGYLHRLRTGKLSSEQENCLDEVAPGWRPGPPGMARVLRTRRTDEFPARAEALGRWLPWADGKVPSGRSDDWYERRLCRWRYEWLAQLRTGTLPSEQEKYLDEVAPGWRPRAGSGIDEFPARAEALGQWFASTGGRVPSDGDDLHERRLCRWRRGWLFHLRNGTLPPERERYLDEVAPGWRPRRTTRDVTVVQTNAAP